MDIRKEAAVVGAGTPDEEQLEKINALAKSPLRAEEVYAFRVRLCDDRPDRDNERFDTAALPRLLTGFLTLSVLLLLARQSIQLSSRRLRLSPAKARALRPDPPFYLTAGIALAVILGAALLQQKLLGLDLPQLLPEGALRGAGQLGICLPVWSMVKSS